ncbi:MAG: beta-propeller fold lactonase family protein [Terracidiphilus sp.]
MKLNKTSQLLLVSAASLLIAGVLTACGTNTVNYVYVTSALAAGNNNYGEIDVLEINRVSGFMRPIPSSPFPSGGRNPVAEAVSTDYSNLYVVNHDDNTIVQFLIGPDGKLYPQNTVNTPGLYPLAVGVDAANLFVVDTYQPLLDCSPANPCSGSVAVFPIQAASGTGSTAVPYGPLGIPISNGTLSYWPLTLLSYTASGNSSNCLTSASTDLITPTAINVLASGADIYVTAYDTTAKPNAGYIFGFKVGTGGGLTPLNCGVPFAAGVHPSAIASATITNPGSVTTTTVYVTDHTNGNVLGYTVNTAATSAGFLTSMAGSPFPTGNQPSAVAVDPTYPFAYVANSLDGTVSGYSIGSGGALTNIGTFTAGVQPVAIGIDPATSHFVFTANFLGNGATGTVSDFEMSTTSGTLINTQHSPYTSNALPTAVAAVPHGGSQP